MEESDESSSSSEELLYSGATNPAGVCLMDSSKIIRDLLIPHFSLGEAHGRGTLIYAKSKNKYEGFFKDGKRSKNLSLHFFFDRFFSSYFPHMECIEMVVVGYIMKRMTLCSLEPGR